MYPDYSQSKFNGLIRKLQNCGCGWLRPEGVQNKLHELQFGL